MNEWMNEKFFYFKSTTFINDKYQIMKLNEMFANLPININACMLYKFFMVNAIEGFSNLQVIRRSNTIFVCYVPVWILPWVQYGKRHKNRLYIRIQIQINQLLTFTEKFSPLPGFKPRTFLVPSLYATKWAFLAWLSLITISRNFRKEKYHNYDI